MATMASLSTVVHLAPENKKTVGVLFSCVSFSLSSMFLFTYDYNSFDAWIFIKELIVIIAVWITIAVFIGGLFSKESDELEETE